MAVAHPSRFQSRVLSKEQKLAYDQNGFFVIKKLVSESCLDKYKQRFEAICRREVKSPGLTIMKDVSTLQSGAFDAMVINKLQNYQDDPVLSEYLELPEIVSVVQDIIGPNVMAMHTMLINKPPDPGTKSSRHPMHQDLHYFPFRPADRIICAWTAMEPVTRENGCLVVVPGSHKGDLLPHEYPEWEGGVNKMYHGIQDYDSSQPRVHLEMDTGDTVFFHPILIHGSGANKTTRFRKAISCHYAASECHYIDVRGTTQENIAQEAIEIAKQRLGPDLEVDYQDVWKIRAKLISGLRSNL